MAIMDRNGGSDIEQMVDGVCELVAEVGVDGGESVESGVQCSAVRGTGGVGMGCGAVEVSFSLPNERGNDREFTIG